MLAINKIISSNYKNNVNSFVVSLKNVLKRKGIKVSR